MQLPQIFSRPILWFATLAVAALGSVFQDQMKGAILSFPHLFINDGLCRSVTESTLIQTDKLTVLLTKLDDDPSDYSLRKLEDTFNDKGNDNFRVIGICKSFSYPYLGDQKVAIDRMIASADSELRKSSADLIIFGKLTPEKKLKLWFLGKNGGCSEKPATLDLASNAFDDALLLRTQSSLISAASNEIMAACNNRDGANWDALTRKVDLISAFVLSDKNQLDSSARLDILIEIFSLSLDRFSRTGELAWSERAESAASYILDSREAAKNYALANLARIDEIAHLYIAYSHTKSDAFLKKGIKLYRITKNEADKRSNSKFIETFGDEVIALLQEGVGKGLATADEVIQARSAVIK